MNNYPHNGCFGKLKIPAAYMSRISNLDVIHRANQILHGRDTRNQGRYQILSSIIRKRAVRFLGHIIREPKEWEHVKKITLNSALQRVQTKI